MPRRRLCQSHAGRYAYEGLDRVMHEKARLGILSSLAAHDEGLAFSDLKEACALTDGNLSRHLAVLSEAKVVMARKGKLGPRHQTRYRLTANGRRRFTAYIYLLGRIVSEASQEPCPEHRRGGFSSGLSST